MKTHQKYLLKVAISSGMLKIELYTSRLVNPFIQEPSTDIGGLKLNVCFAWEILNSYVSPALLNKRFTILSN